MNSRYVIDGRRFANSYEGNCCMCSWKVSFLVPTLNNECTLEKCLVSIRRQLYRNIEIIVIDGFSRDRTLEVARKYSDIIVFDRGTYGSALQTGVELATGDVIAQWDGDIILPDDLWLTKSLAYFALADRVSTLIPLNVSPPASSPLSRLYLDLWRVFICDRVKRDRAALPGRLYLKKCIVKVGGFNRRIHWGADFDLARRLGDIGYRGLYYEEPIWHATMSTLKEYVKKQVLGAKTLADERFSSMGLSTSDILHEHIVLGLKVMVLRLVREKKVEWFYYPIVLLIRLLTYVVAFLRTQKT